MPTCTICGAIATKKVEVALFTSVEEEWRCDTHNPQRKKEENKSEDLSEKYNPSNGYIIWKKNFVNVVAKDNITILESAITYLCKSLTKQS